MGSSSEKVSHRGIMESPKISKSGDHAKWRCDVVDWVNFIIAGSERGDDRVFKSIRATVSCQLYNNGLNNFQKRQVDYVQLQGTIDYKSDDQVKTVQQVIDLVAVESPMVVVTPLIHLFNHVSNCTRKPTEALSNLVIRFIGVAPEHLMQAGWSPNSNMGEFLSIAKLKNGNLGETTLSSPKIQLINAVESRQAGIERNYILDDVDCDNLKSIKESVT